MSQNEEQENFERLVLALPSQYDPEQGTRLVPIARNILKSGVISARIRRVLNDDALASDLAKGSYLHENGFNKLLLFTTQNEWFHLRIHQWLPQEHFEQNVHDHRFNFWSLILSGSLTNNIWGISDSGEEFTHYEYRPRNFKEKYEMVNKGSVRLVKEASLAIIQDEVYYFDHRWIHTTSYSPQSVTVILEDRRALRPHANVFIRRNNVESNTLLYESPALPLEEFRLYLREVSDLLPFVETAPE